MAWDCGAGHSFEFSFHRRLVLNIFPFLVSTAKLLDDFYNNIRRVANSFPCFAYSFVFLMLLLYYLSCDSYSAYRRSLANIKKICENFVLALQIRPASPIGAASAPPLCLLAPNATHVTRTASPIDPELAYNLGSTDQKRKYGKTKMKSK